LVSIVLLASFLGMVKEDPSIGYRGKSVEKSFYSYSVKDKFRVVVYLPRGYETDNTTRYPVIYQLDGNLYGKTTAIMMEHYRYTGEIPVSAIVVGIGYYYDGFYDKRERDFVYQSEYNNPYREKLEGCASFYLFLKYELIPYIERKYRTDDSVYGRTLMGHSMGGYFSLYAMFDQFKYTFQNEEPPVFSNFIAASPIVPDYMGTLLYLESYNSHYYKGAFPIRLYISYCEYELGEETRSFTWLRNRFKNWSFEGFQFQEKYFSRMHQPRTAIPTFKDGLKYIFKLN